ncbi:hypothetical protein S245_056889, partial [Arachis hypogaea]
GEQPPPTLALRQRPTSHCQLPQPPPFFSSSLYLIVAGQSPSRARTVAGIHRRCSLTVAAGFMNVNGVSSLGFCSHGKWPNQ